MILVACCPPGNVSNILTHRAGGDVALSVSMTAVSNLLAIVLMPINMAFWGGLAPDRQRRCSRRSTCDPVEMLRRDRARDRACRSSLGLTIARLWPRFAAAAHRVVGPVSFIALAADHRARRSPSNWDIFVDYIGIVLVAVFLHDALALLLGYAIGRATRLPSRQRKAMTFEVGVRNAGLGLLLVFTYFDGLGGMALVAAWWGIYDIIAGLVVADASGGGVRPTSAAERGGAA